MTVRSVTRAQWEAEGHEHFGSDPLAWAFVCPSCEHVQTTRDYKDVGATIDDVAFNCVGRWVEGSKSAFSDMSPGPCTYAGGGLFTLNPVRITLPDGVVLSRFEWAPAKPHASRGQ